MKSIRISLILYFLLLLGVALGAVSFRVYKTNVESVAQKRDYVARLLAEQYKTRSVQLGEAFDVRLLRRIQLLARLAQNHRYHLESLFPLGALGGFAVPQGHLFGPLWLAQGLEPGVAIPMYEMIPKMIRIETGKEIMADQNNEYYQIYDANGDTQERSDTMGAASFSLDSNVRRGIPLLEETFDNTFLSTNSVRRVTMKAIAATVEKRRLPQLWPHDADPKVQEALVKWQNRLRKKDPEVFIQYAALTTDLDAARSRLHEQHLVALQDLDADNELVLANLRNRLLWISVATFIAVLVGGFWLIRAGLSPLNRLSLAVSRISERDFNLRIRAEQFPTELKPIAQCLTETFEKLERAFEREKQAVADISHELRTPLTSFLANLDVILRKPRSADEYRQVLEDCREAGQHLSRLVERLLTLARLDAGSDTLRPQEVDVVALAQQCATLVRPLADVRGVQIRQHLQDSAPMLADPDKLREVFNNLLHNAIEYNRPNGKIDLTVRSENGNVVLEVADTGVGIPPEASERIFERFYRADPSRQADALHAGIGLAIVKSYIDLMGGTIKVVSSEQGSTFRVELPASGHRPRPDLSI